MTPVPHAFGGIQIIESVHMVEPGTPVTRVRSWRDRLFSADEPGPWYARPWRPWDRADTRIPMIPCARQLPNGTLVAHPALVAELRRVTR